MSDYTSRYTKHTWANGQSPAINASNLNDIETFMGIVDERTRDLDTRQASITPEVAESLVLAPTYAAEATASAAEAAESAETAEYYAGLAEKTEVGQLTERVQTLEDSMTKVITLKSTDNLNDIVDITRVYATANLVFPSNSPTTTYNYYLEVSYDSTTTSPRRRQIVTATGAKLKWERVRDYSGNWSAWSRIDTSNMIVASESKTYDVSFTAGTIGTRAVSDEVDISKSGYTVIGVNLMNNSASASFSVNLMARADTNKVQIRCYRATSSAVSNAYIQYQIIYIRN